MTKLTSKFNSPDNTQTLTITGAQGKRGYNIKASLKNGKGKGSRKAIPGCRETFETEAELKSTFDKLVKETVKRGWVAQEKSVRNAFTEIPTPSASSKKTQKAA